MRRVLYHARLPFSVPRLFISIIHLFFFFFLHDKLQQYQNFSKINFCSNEYRLVRYVFSINNDGYNINPSHAIFYLNIYFKI